MYTSDVFFWVSWWLGRVTEGVRVEQSWRRSPAHQPLGSGATWRPHGLLRSQLDLGPEPHHGVRTWPPCLAVARRSRSEREEDWLSESDGDGGAGPSTVSGIRESVSGDRDRYARRMAEEADFADDY